MRNVCFSAPRCRKMISSLILSFHSSKVFSKSAPDDPLANRTALIFDLWTRRRSLRTISSKYSPKFISHHPPASHQKSMPVAKVESTEEKTATTPPPTWIQKVVSRVTYALLLPFCPFCALLFFFSGMCASSSCLRC